MGGLLRASVVFPPRSGQDHRNADRRAGTVGGRVGRIRRPTRRRHSRSTARAIWKRRSAGSRRHSAFWTSRPTAWSTATSSRSASRDRRKGSWGSISTANLSPMGRSASGSSTLQGAFRRPNMSRSASKAAATGSRPLFPTRSAMSASAMKSPFWRPGVRRGSNSWLRPRPSPIRPRPSRC